MKYDKIKTFKSKTDWDRHSPLIRSKKKYYTYDMAGTRKYFSTKIQANIYRKRIYNKTSMWLKLYKR